MVTLATTIAPTTKRPTPRPTPPLATTDANAILQVNRSHLYRMADFLAMRYQPRGYGCGCGNGNDGDDCAGGGIVIRIVSTRRSTASRLCSLLLLRMDSADSANAAAVDEGKNGGKHSNNDDGGALYAFMEDVTKRFAYVLRGLNKVYVMVGGGSGGSMVIRGRIALALGGEC